MEDKSVDAAAGESADALPIDTYGEEGEAHGTGSGGALEPSSVSCDAEVLAEDFPSAKAPLLGSRAVRRDINNGRRREQQMDGCDCTKPVPSGLAAAVCL